MNCDMFLETWWRRLLVKHPLRLLERFTKDIQWMSLTESRGISAIVLPQFHFLVVDDQQIVRRIVVVLLNLLGYTNVSEAEDGEQALALLQPTDVLDEPINFVITDWNMPQMNGLALLKRIRITAGLQHLPVLMITSVEGDGNINAARQAGADGFIIKSQLSADILKAALDDIVAKRGLAG